MSLFLDKSAAVDRLCMTFSPKDINEKKDRQLRVEALMRFILAIDAAARYVPDDQGLTFSGERPNNYDVLGNYLISGGRIFFDLTELSLAKKREFEKFLFTDEVKQHVIYQRLAATHQVGTSNYKDKKFVFEKKLSPLQGLLNAIKQLFGRIMPSHFGMDVGIGGSGHKVIAASGDEVSIRNNGEFGHLYINKPPNLDAIQMGIEEAAPGQSFVVGGGWHGPNGKGAKYTACMRPHLKEENFGPDGQDHIIPIEDKNAAYSWNRVKITSAVVDKLKDISDDYTDPTRQENISRIKDILKKPPHNHAVIVDYDERNKKIVQYRKDHGLFQSVFVEAGVSRGVSSLLQKNGVFSSGNQVTLFYSQLMKETKSLFEEKLITLAILKHQNQDELKKHISDSLKLPVDELTRKIGKSMIVDLQALYKVKKERYTMIHSIKDLIKKIHTHANNNAVNEALIDIQGLNNLQPKDVPLCQQVNNTL